MSGKKVLIIGPAHPLRGGLASFNQRLAREFLAEGDHCELVSFSLQYPGFLFPGTTQYTDDPPPEGLVIRTVINSVNPLNWISVGRKLRLWKADIIVVRFWLPVIGPALGTILRRITSNRHTRIICIADNILPHEKRPGDKAFIKYFLRSCQAFITMSEKVMNDLRQFEPTKPAVLLRHPLYDNFGAPLNKEDARRHLGLDPEDRILLFFGFIRKYKGLDLLLEAMSLPAVKELKLKLLVAGEFYEDDQPYHELIKKLSLEDSVILRTNFIADDDVKYYLSAADCVVQPYRSATQSGVTPLAYHFNKPMIVTNVGGLPAMVPNEKVGLICEPEPAALATAIAKFYTMGKDHFLPFIQEEKKKYSWQKLTSAIKTLAGQIKS